jgi:hypothetical protein
MKLIMNDINIVYIIMHEDLKSAQCEVHIFWHDLLCKGCTLLYHKVVSLTLTATNYSLISHPSSFSKGSI